MKNLKAKLIILLIVMITIMMIIPFSSVSAVENGVQLIKTADGDVVIYIDGLEEKAFEYAISNKPDATEMDLNYINSVEDDEGNQVVLISAEDFSENENNLFVKTEDKNVTYSLDYSDMLTQEKIDYIKNTSNRIATNIIEKIEDRTETIDGKEYTYTVGGLEIKADENAQYFYQISKTTAKEYDELQTLADNLNSKDYDNKPMYEKIELANNFYNLYNELIGKVEWKQVEENMVVKQPSDASDGEKYIVMLKKVADGETTYDAKFMESKLGIEEGEDKDVQEIAKQETSKLPITGDSIVLFVLLAVLVIISIFVYIRIKKLNKKADK